MPALSLATLLPPPWATAPSRSAVEALIMRLEPEAAEPSGAAMDAAVMAALGWQVRAEPRARQPAWRCRGPWTRQWMPVPAVSVNATACADFVLPWRCDHGAGVREGKPFAWARLPAGQWFETTGTTPARCLLKAALHAHRSMLLQQETAHA